LTLRGVSIMEEEQLQGRNFDCCLEECVVHKADLPKALLKTSC